MNKINKKSLLLLLMAVSSNFAPVLNSVPDSNTTASAWYKKLYNTLSSKSKDGVSFVTDKFKQSFATCSKNNRNKGITFAAALGIVVTAYYLMNCNNDEAPTTPKA